MLSLLYTMSCTYGFLKLSKEDSMVDKHIGPLPDGRDSAGHLKGQEGRGGDQDSQAADDQDGR